MSQEKELLAITMRIEMARIRRGIVNGLKTSLEGGIGAAELIEMVSGESEEARNLMSPLRDEVEALSRQLKHCIEILK